MSKKKRKIIRCKLCKKRFTKVHKRIYCSEECSDKARVLRKKAFNKKNGHKYRKYETIWSKNIKRLCARSDCGWYFRARHNATYCSERCRFIAVRRLASKRNKHSYRTNPEHRAALQELSEKYRGRKYVSTPKLRALKRKQNRKQMEK